MRINRGTLNNVMSSDPLATEPKWYFSNLQIECSTGESVGLRKYQKATAPANDNCWQATKIGINLILNSDGEHSNRLTKNKFARPN